VEKKKSKLVLVLAVSGALALATSAIAADGGRRFATSLSGYEETPAVSTTANGRAVVNLTPAREGFNYRLTYSALEGDVTQAHIHFGQKDVAGGIGVFLCSNLGTANTVPCPPGPTTVEGTIDATDVIGPTAQGIAPGEIAELVKAIKAGKTYANVHSSKFPSGEIRGQLNLTDN
jgi:hypothetical protein